jgi:cytochrome P450
MLKLTQEMFGAEDPDIARAAEDDAMRAVLLDFVHYFTALAADRRAEPTEDLASVIANARIDGQPLADLDTLGHYVIIATAGHDTTSSAIAGGLLALLEHPDQLERLQANPELIDQAADEIIRYVSPVKHFMRNCQEPFTLRGVAFRPGDLLYLSYASANRDEDVFADPMRLDVTRENAASHLAFGFGRHFCLGAHLARMEVRAIFRELLRRVDHIELEGEPKWIHAYFVQGPKSIPIRYRMR